MAYIEPMSNGWDPKRRSARRTALIVGVIAGLVYVTFMLTGVVGRV